MKNKKITLLIILIILIITISGCQLNKENIEEKTDKVIDEKVGAYYPEVGGEIVVPLTTLSTLNPLMSESINYYYFSKLIFESLFEFDDNLNVEKQLIEDYTITDDGKIIDIKLKENITWHDGQPLTSEDINFTINTIKHANEDSTYNKMLTDALGPLNSANIRRILEVNIINDQNFIITFDRSFSNNLEVLTFPIIPKHIFAKDGVNNKAYRNALELENYTPIGTGPFKFESYEKMKKINLVANEKYRGKRPYIDRVLGKVFDNEEDIFRAFEIGQVDMATAIGFDWEKYSQNDGMNSLEFISANYEFIGFNFDKEIFQEEAGKTLRRSIAYAINRQGIIEDIYLGHATQVDVPIHPRSWLISDSVSGLGYNLDMAKEEIKKIDIQDADENGESISINLLTNTLNPARLKTAVMIKEDLKKIGIDVNIFPQEESENKTGEDITVEDLQEQWEEVNEILSLGEYDMVLLGWQISIIPDLAFAFHSSQINDNGNFIKYSNIEMDNLLEELSLNGNRNEKKEKYEKLQNLIVDDLPYISLFFKNKSLLLDNKIFGELKPSFFNPYKGFENIYIPNDLR